MIISKIASAAFNSIVSGLSGYEATLNIPLSQLEDECVETRLQILQKYAMINKLPLKDLYYSINCIELDCASLDACCEHDPDDELVAHFQIPQLFSSVGDESINWIGSTDKQIRFKVYTSAQFRFHKYKTRRSRKPFVYINTSPNGNNMYDCYVFNAPMLERISISAIFKDPRQLEAFACCSDELEKDNLSALAIEIKDTIVGKYIKYYRQLYPQPQPNTQIPQ